MGGVGLGEDEDVFWCSNHAVETAPRRRRLVDCGAFAERVGRQGNGMFTEDSVALAITIGAKLGKPVEYKQKREPHQGCENERAEEIQNTEPPSCCPPDAVWNVS